MNQSAEISSQCANGTIRELDGRKRIYYDGYWIIYYEPPPESLSAKKNMIVNLTRRAFHHTEPGINTPGENLDHARRAYESAANPAEKRVNASMLAGALFNRATDIFKSIVDLEQRGVHISFENELMQQCNDCLQEAMELGSQVRHYSGMEGIDELWGEPLKAFTMTMKEFYASRYVKISMGMRDIDKVIDRLIDCLGRLYAFHGLEPRLREFADAAKRDCELIKSDPAMFEVWPRFVASTDSVKAFSPAMPISASEQLKRHIGDGSDLLQEGRRLIVYIAGARVPMPQPTEKYLERIDRFNEQTKRIVEDN